MGYKEKTHEVLMNCYQQKGCKVTLEAARTMLLSKRHKDDTKFAIALHGELCETVLEILLKDYMKNHPKETVGWSVFRGLILKNRESVKRDFCTEIDLTLFTPACVYLFECKSYAGDKILTGNGVLTRVSEQNGTSQFNVYRQSVIHRDTMLGWIQDFVLPGKIPLIQMCMFNFSRGSLEDRRSNAAKMEMPCLDESSVVQYVLQLTEPVWNPKCLAIAGGKLEEISKMLQKQHLVYVKGLHGGVNK